MKYMKINCKKTLINEFTLVPPSLLVNFYSRILSTFLIYFYFLVNSYQSSFLSSKLSKVNFFSWSTRIGLYNQIQLKLHRILKKSTLVD